MVNDKLEQTSTRTLFNRSGVVCMIRWSDRSTIVMSLFQMFSAMVMVVLDLLFKCWDYFGRFVNTQKAVIAS